MNWNWHLYRVFHRIQFCETFVYDSLIRNGVAVTAQRLGHELISIPTNSLLGSRWTKKQKSSVMTCTNEEWIVPCKSLWRGIIVGVGYKSIDYVERLGSFRSLAAHFPVNEPTNLLPWQNKGKATTDRNRGKRKEMTWSGEVLWMWTTAKRKLIRSLNRFATFPHGQQARFFCWQSFCSWLTISVWLNRPHTIGRERSGTQKEGLDYTRQTDRQAGDWKTQLPI